MSDAARAKELDTAAARLGRGLLALRLEVSPDIVAEIHQLAQAAIAEQTARAEAAEIDRDSWKAAAELWERNAIQEMEAARLAEALVGRLRAFVTRIRDWSANVDGSELLSEDLDAAVSIFEDARALLAEAAP